MLVLRNVSMVVCVSVCGFTQALVSLIEIEGVEITLEGGAVGVPAFVSESSSADFRKIQLA